MLGGEIEGNEDEASGRRQREGRLQLAFLLPLWCHARQSGAVQAPIGPSNGEVSLAPLRIMAFGDPLKLAPQAEARKKFGSRADAVLFRQ